MKWTFVITLFVISIISRISCDSEDCHNINEADGELTKSQCAPINRSRRQAPGGPLQLNVDDEDVKLFLNEALTEVNASEEPDYSIKEITEATSQVVAGRLVKFTVKLLSGENEVECKFEVWERVWLEDGREVKINCDNEKHYKLKQKPQGKKVRERRDTLVGAPAEIDNNDEKVLSLLSTNLKRLDTGSDSALELVSVDKITRQIVSGLSYKVKGTFKNGELTPYACTIDIWNRPWIEGDDGTQIKAECENGVRLKTKRVKRSIRPMSPHHHKFHSKETSELKAREIKSEVLFENFVKKYHRRYGNDLEHKMRHRIFRKNLHKIDMLNKHEMGTAKYGITPFADLTEKEYLHKTGLLMRERHENDLPNPLAEIPDIDVKDLPTEFDWTEKGAVTSVKNQGNCGSCWSFSVTGNIEGLHAIKTGKLEAYSEQELLDCDTTDNACNGGYMDDAFKAIEKIGGLELEDQYPYKAKKQKKCLFNSTLSHVKVKGVVDMPKADEIAMQKYLVANGPISIGINAAAMQFYRGGVSHPWKILCRKSDLDHGVLLVGYGIKSYPMFNKTLPYWKIKNSWGPKWGEQGFYRIYRGDNSCGVAEMASSAVLE
ncbi:CLUMA_CG014251, isoform B [Clunio marinus]|uniref:CLUMA_CG014251, isoform B n=1 Tax=Clunio marinus TaxID=568069 RepID=A0A1J1IPQ2_9DIPT|nr:CLUMA_CG014251, isoform B [Clunio marinus]